MTRNTPPLSSGGNTHPVSRRAFAFYMTALAAVLGAALLRETQPPTQATVVVFWTSIVYGVGCLLHLAGNAALQRFISWIRRELNSDSPQESRSDL